jgi:hypothetical protein
MNIPKIVLSIEEKQALNEEICNTQMLKQSEPTDNNISEHIQAATVLTNVMNLKHQFETNGPQKEEAKKQLLVIYQSLLEKGYMLQ